MKMTEEEYRDFLDSFDPDADYSENDETQAQTEAVAEETEAAAEATASDSTKNGAEKASASTEAEAKADGGKQAAEGKSSDTAEGGKENAEEPSPETQKIDEEETAAINGAIAEFGGKSVSSWRDLNTKYGRETARRYAVLRDAGVSAEEAARMVFATQGSRKQPSGEAADATESKAPATGGKEHLRSSSQRGVSKTHLRASEHDRSIMRDLYPGISDAEIDRLYKNVQ